MIRRAVETFFRHKWLILLPPVLIPLIVTPIVVFSAKPYYETWAGIWIARPMHLSYTNDWNQYITPAQNQSERLHELLRTHSFPMAVASRTELAEGIGSPESEQAIQQFISSNLGILPNGPRLLNLRFRAESPELALETMNAVIEAYQERVAADRISQADLAISFYEKRLVEAEERLAEAQQGVQRYVAANPGLLAPPASGTSAQSQALAATDIRFPELTRLVENEQEEVERVRGQLERARIEASASLQADELSFQVLDAPRLPTAPILEKRRLLVFPAAALLAGVGLSTVLLILLIALDRTIRRDSDLPPDVLCLGSLPSIRLEGIPKERQDGLIRQALSSIAGSRLAGLPGSLKVRVQ